MNKKFLLVGVGLLILIAGVFTLGLRFSSGYHSVTKSLQELLASTGSDQKCIFQGDASYSGEVYVSKSRLRADIRHLGKTAHLVLSGVSATQWYDDSKAGLQVAFSEVDSIDVSKKFSFLCQNSIVDEKMFTPPTDNLYYPSKKVLDDYNAQNQKPECQVCAELQGEASATCKKQLNCP